MLFEQVRHDHGIWNRVGRFAGAEDDRRGRRYVRKGAGRGCDYSVGKDAILMLVLSRRPGESIQVGDEILISVQKVVGPRVYLSITAPRDVRILRTELLEQKEEESST